jgi:MFS family permease
MLRAPYALFAGALLLEGTSDVQLVALALGKLGMGNGGPGLLFAVWGVGGVLGSALIVFLVRRRGYGLVLAAGTLMFSAGLAAAGADGVALALAVMVPAGAGFALVESAIVGLVPRLADDALIGRVYALSEILYAAGGGLGALLAPLLIATFGAAGSLAVVGIVLGTGAIVGWRACARIDAGQEQAARVRELLRGVGFLAPLPLPRLERLVREARALTATPGTEIVRLGERGEDFYVIEQGTVEIVEYWFARGPGEGFGEIALLREVPRTATVRAASDVRLWALGRTAFIGAVTNHVDSQRLADELISERLTRPRLDAGHTSDTADILRLD